MPIADVAGDTAGRAALEEVAHEMTRAESEGRVVKRIALTDIDRDRLERDRRHIDAEDLEALQTSIEARGQQTPIEVMATGNGQYGLISGLRRLMALEALGVPHALAFVRRPESAADAYVAMVEENEVRVGLSFYERAAVACEAADAGVFPDDGTAIAALFATATSAKRWKIMKFVTAYKLLDDVLRFPEALPEKFGLALIDRIEADLDFYKRLKDRLRKTPSADAATERAVLEKAMRDKGRAPAPGPTKDQLAPGLALEARAGRVVLSGKAVDEAFLEALREFALSHAKASEVTH
jgi:ParB family chromosome partitioning protein